MARSRRRKEDQRAIERSAHASAIDTHEKEASPLPPSSILSDRTSNIHTSNDRSSDAPLDRVASGTNVSIGMNVSLEPATQLCHIVASPGRTNVSGSGCLGNTQTRSVPNVSSRPVPDANMSSHSRTSADLDIDVHDENEPLQPSTARKRKGRQNKKPRKKNKSVLDEGWARDLEDTGKIFARTVHIFPSFLDIALLALKTINALNAASEEDPDPEDYLEEDTLSISLLMLISPTMTLIP